MPAYTMGKSKKQSSFYKAQDTPGVGAYHQQLSWNKTSRIRSNPSNSMTKAPKMHTFKIQQNVGPGSYSPQKPPNTNGPTLKGRHTKRFQTQAPSPAEYNYFYQRYHTEKKFPSKQYTIGKQRRKLVVPDGPGPAAYDMKDLNKTCVNIFSRDQKPKEINCNPGPGNYQNQSQKVLKKNPFYSFSKQKKFIEDEIIEKEKKKIPGPGNYNSTKEVKNFRGGKFTHASRDNSSTSLKLKNVGPGSYDLKISHFQKPSNCKFGNTSRFLTEQNQQMPGPGAYDTTEIEKTKKNYGTSVFTQGRKTVEHSLSPGPATYEMNKKYESVKGPSMGSKKEFKNKQVRPDPQTYYPNYRKVKKNNGIAVMGTEQKFKKLKTQNPGPGQYRFLKQNKSKSFFFTRSSQKQKMNQTVGPGQYKLKPYIGVYDGYQKEKKQFYYV